MKPATIKDLKSILSNFKSKIYNRNDVDEKIGDLKLRTHIGEKLDYLSGSINGVLSSSIINSNIKFNTVNSNNLKIEEDGSIILSAHKTYEIKCTISSSSESNLLTYGVYNVDSDSFIDNISGISVSVAYTGSGNTSSATPLLKILKFNTDTKISIRGIGIAGNSNGKATIFGSLSIQEIGREVLINEVEEVAKSKHIEDTPVGHIMSIMGVNAPPHYLICDGSEYNITDYPKLAEYFKNELGKINYFGGDGTNTFAVPDMREASLVDIGLNTTQDIKSHNEYNIGEFKDDQMQNIKGSLGYYSYKTGDSSGIISNSVINANSGMSLNDSSGNTQYTRASINADNRIRYDSTDTTHGKQIGVLFCIKYEPTYFMEYSPMYGGFNETVLFEGEANAIGEYSLNDSIKDYKILIVYCSQNWSSGDNILMNAMTINVDNIVNNKNQQFEFNQSIASTSDDRRIIFTFDLDKSKLKVNTVTKSKSDTCNSMQISKIIGIKANSNTVVTNEPITIDSITYTDDELKSAINNIKGGDNNG